MEFQSSQVPNAGYEVASATTSQGNAQSLIVPSLKLFVKGFTPMEQRLLNGTVLLSRRRQPRLDLADDGDARLADVVMIDGADPAAMRWAADQTWLKQKVVIWVDAPIASRMHIALRRPVQWTSLPIILARALEQNPRNIVDADATIPASAPSRRAVLVVDDSLAVRAYLRSLLEPRGFIVTDVDSAEAGVDAACSNSYACILMDVLMPGIDGYEACRRIKARTRSGSGAAIVMLTSKSSPFDRIRGKMAGCDAYLTKPVDAHTLYDVLSRYVTLPVQNAPTGVAQKWSAGRAAIGRL